MGVFAKLFAHRGPQAHGHGSHGHGSHGHGAHGHGAHGHGASGHESSGHAAHGHGVMSHAGSYDRLTRLVTLGRRDRIYAGLAALSAAGPGDHAVDLGCGTGALTRALAARVGPVSYTHLTLPTSDLV